MTKLAIAAIALIVPACAGAIPTVADARKAVDAAKEAQAVACSGAYALPSDMCSKASHDLLLAQDVLAAAEALQKRLDAHKGGQ